MRVIYKTSAIICVILVFTISQFSYITITNNLIMCIGLIIMANTFDIMSDLVNITNKLKNK